MNQPIFWELLYPVIINLDIRMTESWMVVSEIVQPLLYMAPANTEVFKHCCVIRINSSPSAQDNDLAFIWKKWKVFLEFFIFTNKVAAVTTVLVLATTDLPNLHWLLSVAITDN